MPIIKTADDESQVDQGGEQPAEVQSAAPNPTRATAQRAATETSQQGSGSQFGNFNRLLQANQGKIEEQAKQITGVINKEALDTQTAAQDIGRTQSQIAEGSKTGSVNISDISDTSGNEFKAAQKILNPQTYSVGESFQPALEQARTLKETAESSKTQEGIGNIANQWRDVNKIAARKGESTLGNILLGRDTGARKVFQSLQENVPKTLETVQQEKQKAETIASDVNKANLEAAKTLREQLKTASDISTQQAGYEAISPEQRLASDVSTIKEYLANQGLAGQFSDQELADMQRGNVARNYVETLSPQEFARQNALRALQGLAPLERSQYVAPKIDVEGIANAARERRIQNQPVADATVIPKAAPVAPEHQASGSMIDRGWGSVKSEVGKAGGQVKELLKNPKGSINEGLSKISRRMPKL